MTRVRGPNGFTNFKAKLRAGQTTHIVIWSDSTGNNRDNTGRWPARFAADIAALYPTHTVILHTYNTTSTTSYDAATTISTGSTGAEAHIWVFAVSGSVPQYGMGSIFLIALASVPADGLIINHGINIISVWDVGGQAGASARGAMVAAIEQFLSVFPHAPVSTIIQAPNQGDTSLDNMPIYWQQVAQHYGIGVIDVYSVYIAAGKPLAWYVSAGDVHPSEPTGNIQWENTVWAHFLAASPIIDVPPRPSLLMRQQVPLLVNGGFTKWTVPAAAPDGWTASGTIAFTQDTANAADEKQGYSVKMLGSGSGQTKISQVLSAAAKAAILGKPVTLSVKKKVGVAGNTTVGRFGITFDATAYVSVGYVLKQDDFAWWSMQGIIVPAAVTTATVILYQDTNATPDAVNAVWLDQVSLEIGYKPMAAR